MPFTPSKRRVRRTRPRVSFRRAKLEYGTPCHLLLTDPADVLAEGRVAHPAHHPRRVLLGWTVERAAALGCARPRAHHFQCDRSEQLFAAAGRSIVLPRPPSGLGRAVIHSFGLSRRLEARREAGRL